MSRKLHDTKNDFKSRNILAFCLFVVLGILSVACVTKAVLLNGSVVQNQFTDFPIRRRLTLQRLPTTNMHCEIPAPKRWGSRPQS